MERMGIRNMDMVSMNLSNRMGRGRIDLHMHILPGIDDGAATMEESVEMAQIALDSGTDTVVATPHGDFSRSSPKEHMRKCSWKLQMLQRELADRKIPLRVTGGMELMLNEALVKWAEGHRLPGINGSRWLLTEFDFDISIRRALTLADELSELGYRLILAHPERYDLARRQPENLLSFYRRGILLQINKGSLFGEFGGSAFRAAEWMLSNEIAGIVASDAHDAILRTPDMENVIEMLELYYGMDAAEVLTEKTPGWILGDKEFQ